MPPLFFEIEKDLADKIQRGEFAPDEPIPTELKLCEIYGVSRITVRRAVERLVAARMIYRRRGVGTFVHRRQTDGKSLQLIGHMQDVLTFSQQLSARIYERGQRVPPPAVRSAFGIHDSEKLYAMTAVNFLNGEPYAVTHSFLAPELSAIGPKIEMRGGKTSIRYIEELTGIRARSGEQSIEATAARGQVAAKLGVKSGTAILSAFRIYFGDGAHPIEVVVVYYHPARYRIQVELLATDSFAGSRHPDAAGSSAAQMRR